MPLTVEEQKELASLEDVFGQKAPVGLQPEQSGITATGITSIPVPEFSPNLTPEENEEFFELEKKFEPEKPTLPPRQFKSTADEFVRALGRGSLNVGSGLLAQFADVGRDSIFDVEKINELAETAREISRKPEFQPGTDGGVRGFIANAVGDALPFMAGTIGATLAGGPIAGFAVAYAVEGKNAYFDALDAGASERDAEIEGFVVGSINAALELLQVERVIKFAGAGKGSVKQLARAAKQKSLKRALVAGKRITKEALKLSITEGIQEALQETTSTLAPALTGRELPTLAEAGRRIGQAALGGAVVGPILGGAGAITQAALEGKTTFSRKDVKELGIDKETSAEERQQIFDEAKKEIEEVALPERKDLAAEARAELEQVPEPAVEIDQKTEVRKLLDDLDDQGKIVETFQDLVDEIEAISEDSPELQAAVDDFRQEQIEDDELKGRGDLDAAEDVFRASMEEFLQITPQVAVEKPKKPSPEKPAEAPVAKVKPKGRKAPPKAVAAKPAAKKAVKKKGRIVKPIEVAEKKGKLVPDSKLETKEEMTGRIKSIERQIDELSSVRTDKGSETRDKKITKLAERKEALHARRLKIIIAERKQKAEPAEPTERKVEDEQEAIIEPTTSPEVEQREAGRVVPEATGKLDPADPEEALKIIELHKENVTRRESRVFVGGIFQSTAEGVVTSIEYTSEQVNTAYRNVQKAIPSPLPDTALFAMPGKEKQLLAIAETMRKIKPQKPKGRKAPTLTKPTPLPRAKTKKEDHIKAVHKVATKEETRFAINGVLVEGENLVATDGRRLFVAKGEWGKDGLYLDKAALKKGSLGKAVTQTKEEIEEEGEKRFPKWQDIVPDVSSRDAIEVGNLGEMWRRVRQAMLITTEESKGVVVLVNKDGSLGFSAASPEVGTAEVNINPGATVLGGLNPQFLLDSIAFHATRGDDFFEFYFPQWDKPILTRSSDNRGKTFTVIMPVNIDIEETQKAVSKEVPAEKGYGAKNTGVSKEQAAKDLKELSDPTVLGSGLNPAALVKVARLGAFHAEALTRAGIEQAVIFAEWSAKMIEDLGDRVKPHLDRIWADVKVEAEPVEVVTEEKVKKPVPKKPAEAKKVKSTSVIAKQMKDTLADQGIELGIEYDPISIEEEVEKATAFVATKPAEAKRVAFGSVNPTDIVDNAVRLAYFNQMVQDKNWDEASKIANWIRAENTRLGQNIVVNRGFIDDNSPTKFIKQVATSRMATAGQKFGRGKKGTGVKKITERIQQEVAKVKEKTEAVRMNIDNAQAFIESLRC